MAKFFGPNRHIAKITIEEAADFRQWLLTEGSALGGPLATTTTSRRCRWARQIFAIAVDEGWITKNPFGQMKKWSEVNASRDTYVTVETIQKLIDAAPDAEARLLLALTRFCGLRCPSEIHPLEWDWFDFEHGTFRVLSPKTEHYEGQAWRSVPIFENVADYVQDSWDLALIGQMNVFPNFQVTGSAITGKFQRLCRAIGIDSWQKFWINIRASCERDLLTTYPIDQVAAWLGHSPETALRHYSRVVKEQEAREAAGALRVEARVLTRSKKRSAIGRRSGSPRRPTTPKTRKTRHNAS